MSMRATEPFRIRTPAPPLPVIRRPRNLNRLGLCPTIRTPSRSAYFSISFWKAAKSESGPSAELTSTVASYPSSVPTNCAVCRDRFSGLETITSICTRSAAQHARHQHALLLAFLYKGALVIEFEIFARNAGVGMAH